MASQAAADIQGQNLRIAHIDAPLATDAEGTPVPLSLNSSGDQISVTVPHRGEGFEYPIAVDPIVETEAWEIDWEPFPVYREETYVSGQELTLKQVGWWDAKNCRSVSCAPDTKVGWYKVPGNLVAWLPAGPTSASVGPLYTAVWSPVFSTRQVLDHWAARQVLSSDRSGSAPRIRGCIEVRYGGVWQRSCANVSFTRTWTLQVSLSRGLSSDFNTDRRLDAIGTATKICKGMVAYWNIVPGIGDATAKACTPFALGFRLYYRDAVREAGVCPELGCHLGFSVFSPQLRAD